MMWAGHSPIHSGLTPLQVYDALRTEEIARILALRMQLARFNARPVVDRRRVESQRAA